MAEVPEVGRAIDDALEHARTGKLDRQSLDHKSQSASSGRCDGMGPVAKKVKGHKSLGVSAKTRPRAGGRTIGSRKAAPRKK
jgi:hypothetical protein